MLQAFITCFYRNVRKNNIGWHLSQVSPNFGLWALIWPVQPSHWTHTDLSVYKKAKIISNKSPCFECVLSPHLLCNSRCSTRWCRNGWRALIWTNRYVEAEYIMIIPCWQGQIQGGLGAYPFQTTLLIAINSLRLMHQLESTTLR